MTPPGATHHEQSPDPEGLVVDRAEEDGVVTEAHSVWIILTAMGLMIQRVRVNQGWRQGALAARIGVSQSVLCRIEMGERVPQLRVVLTLCGVLGVRLSDILRIAEDEAYPIGVVPWTDHAHSLLRQSTPLEHAIHERMAVITARAQARIQAEATNTDSTEPEPTEPDSTGFESTGFESTGFESTGFESTGFDADVKDGDA
jgi:transcriptional regulator with XRE-family HTH domain